jgi:integrase
VPAADGKHLSLGTFATRRDAEQALVLAEAEALRRARPLGASGTVAEWGERWLRDGERRWRAKTAAGYAELLRGLVLPRWGQVPVGEVRRADVLGWVEDLAAAGRSPARVRHAVGTLQRILRWAVEHEALPGSPIERLRLPTPRPAEVRPLTVEEVERLARTIEHPEYPQAGHGAGQLAHRLHRPDLALWVRLGAYCGRRAGEVLARRRESVDLVRRVLTVDRSVSDVGGRLVVGPTKTGRARAVPIPGVLVPDLREHPSSRVGPEPDALLFASETGGLVSHAAWYRRRFRPAVARAGLPERLRYHDLRHTYAALLIARGAHPRAIMERLGHSSIQVTLGTYGHLFPTLDQALTSRLDQAIAAARQEANGTEVARRPRRRNPSRWKGWLTWGFTVRPEGFEPSTCGLRVRCSAVELEAQPGSA